MDKEREIQCLANEYEYVDCVKNITLFQWLRYFKFVLAFEKRFFNTFAFKYRLLPFIETDLNKD